MAWKPITKEKILDKIKTSWEQMSHSQRIFWEAIRIDPEKWEQHPYGDEGDGFWVVAIYGNSIIWYNDIEDGFNRSKYTEYGKFEEYFCDQDELEWTLQHILDEIKDRLH